MEIFFLLSPPLTTGNVVITQDIKFGNVWVEKTKTHILVLKNVSEEDVQYTLQYDTSLPIIIKRSDREQVHHYYYKWHDLDDKHNHLSTPNLLL